ncbi:MAG: hypothetical protein LBS61_01105 [Endomicrobium sp.]|nr:hypothetical protein [Endomicrobium sp.]
MRLLKDMGMTPEETSLIMSAIGNHEEQSGDPVNPYGGGFDSCRQVGCA